ncbi:c-type cytochrome [Planctomicrobium sp. SH664]|uniref:c-type cytochrome n=1 Tax=Planctomicrobium sp. SH664 TaxID=3448125 RepID=UPI003F5BD0DC
MAVAFPPADWSRSFSMPGCRKDLALWNRTHFLAASLCITVLGLELCPFVFAENPPPGARALPEGPLGEVIERGRTLVEQTTSHPLTKPYIGNALNCTSCHLKNGTDPRAATFLGVATAYPAWSPREQRVITLEDRILNCFMRSCHGTRPPLGSEVSVSIAAYITWLSEDQPLKMNGKSSLGPSAVPVLKLDLEMADQARGKDLYTTRCAACHGDDGQGDNDNPPVWGKRSFNDGAGLADVIKLASWLKVSMPLDETDLTEQEALDLAAYVNSHERPAFQLREHMPETSRLGEYNSRATP